MCFSGAVPVQCENSLELRRTQNSELRILFNIIHEDCNKLVIVTIIKITVIKGKKYETKYIILFNKKKL